MKHIISFSGGIGSFFTTIRVIEKYGKDNVIMVFCDTKSEDEDLYRFNEDVKRYLNVEFITLTEGRDIWQVAFDDNFVFNSRVANCTHKLKGNLFRKWLKSNYKPNECKIHLGFGWEEMHRIEKSQRLYKPYEVECLLSNEPYLSKNDMFDLLKEIGIEKPRLYEMGFSHNNCGGFCFRAGIGHFKNLYEKMPDRYKYHENKELALIEKIGKEVSILRRVRNGNTINITLKDLREEWENDRQLTEEEIYDIGGCGCFDGLDGE